MFRTVSPLIIRSSRTVHTASGKCQACCCYCNVPSFNYNQQDPTLYNILYYCQCSTCFGRFLRPHQALKNCTHSIWYVPALLLLSLAVAASKLLRCTFFQVQPPRRSKLAVSCKLVSGTVLLEIHVNIVHLRAIKQPLKINKMQRYTIFFITVTALHVSGGFSVHYPELKNYTHSIWYVPGLLLLPLAVAAAVTIIKNIV
jgi:cytochrome c-type biogenesis protein CcmH/NrfF